MADSFTEMQRSLLKRAHWEKVITDDGPHLRLKGGNGEIVLVSQVYADAYSIHEALAVAAAASAFDVVTVDERTHSASCDTTRGGECSCPAGDPRRNG